jgi:hypothetical protein
LGTLIRVHFLSCIMSDAIRLLEEFSHLFRVISIFI